MQLAPTPRSVVLEDGPSRLLRFARPVAAPAPAPELGGLPVLLVSSPINPWYVLDLRPGGSVVAALVAQGLDVFCLDWGRPRDEDRFFTWGDMVARVARFARATRRAAGSRALGLLGYSMGGTLAGIHAALHPGEVAALVNLAGPFDFSNVGLMGRLTDPAWFDPDAVTSAGNVPPLLMQAAFHAVRPTHLLARAAALLDPRLDHEGFEAIVAAETWAHDTVTVPAAAHATYLRELYQQNQLVRGEHRVLGRRVDLGAYRAPLLTVATDRDDICPVAAARGLNDAVGSPDRRLLVVPGGHISGVVGPQARHTLYPALGAFLRDTLTRPARAA